MFNIALFVITNYKKLGEEVGYDGKQLNFKLIL